MVCKDEMWKKIEDWGSEWSGGAKNDVGEETIEAYMRRERSKRVNLIKLMLQIYVKKWLTIINHFVRSTRGPFKLRSILGASIYILQYV